MHISINPKDGKARYIRYLNQCFPNWGGEDLFDWCFLRQVGELTADIMIVEDNESGVLAGSGVTYRPVVLADNSTVQVGIMTGSWTLPNARGRGCFTRIIEESVNLCRTKGAAFLIAFVTEDNASYRRLAAAGASLFPTHYLFSQKPSQSKLAEPSPKLTSISAKTLFEQCLQKPQGGIHFNYSGYEEWASQFLDRPGTIEPLAIESGGYAVLQITHDAERVLFLSPGPRASYEHCISKLIERASGRGRRLILFTTSNQINTVCQHLEFDRTGGYITALIADETAFSNFNRKVLFPSGGLESVMYQNDSSWFMGSWSVQSGDRM